jgi:hypothetical protein
MSGIEENDRVAIIEERLALLEQKEQEKSSITDNEVHTNFFVARTCLFLVTVAVILASLLTFGPTFEHSTLNHIFIESLYPISLVAWTVHEHIYASVAQDDNSGRLKLCTLDGIHFLLSASTFMLCFLHCFFIENIPYVLFQGTNGVVSLLPFFFLPDLRRALRENAVRTNKGADLGVVAIKRGISILSLMTFLLTEATGCIGVDAPIWKIPEKCQYAAIDNFILNHLAFLNLFDMVIVETGIVPSRSALIQCRPSIPVSIRVCAMGAALLTIFCIGLFSTRQSLVLMTPPTANDPNFHNMTTKEKWKGVPSFTTAGVITPLPMLGWMIIQAVIFCNMRKYLSMPERTLEGSELRELESAKNAKMMGESNLVQNKGNGETKKKYIAAIIEEEETSNP